MIFVFFTNNSCIYHPQIVSLFTWVIDGRLKAVQATHWLKKEFTSKKLHLESRNYSSLQRILLPLARTFGNGIRKSSYECLLGLFVQQVIYNCVRECLFRHHSSFQRILLQLATTFGKMEYETLRMNACQDCSSSKSFTTVSVNIYFSERTNIENCDLRTTAINVSAIYYYFSIIMPVIDKSSTILVLKLIITFANEVTIPFLFKVVL